MMVKWDNYWTVYVWELHNKKSDCITPQNKAQFNVRNLAYLVSLIVS